MALSLRSRVIERLQSLPNAQQTARDLALWIFEQYPQECAEKKSNSASYIKTDADLVQQLVAEISSQRTQWQNKHPQLKTTESRPRRYYWTELAADAEVEAAESGSNLSIADGGAPLKEHALYPLLAKFLNVEKLGVRAMRIDEKRSSNRAGNGGNEWLHPDLVGLEDLTADWGRGIRECVSVLGAARARLWSFEVKLLLNRSNARKSFFQAVSNSSWAHFGYLVASTVEGDGTLKELRMLAAAHGIGLIQLDVVNPTESQILIPARERSEVDWDMCNRLATENSDFSDFIGRLRRFHQTGELSDMEWTLQSPGSAST
ncbi:HrgA protein [Pseudomonas aeruginosa]|uniref:COG2958 family protein n=1 Tax=Pseudomonas aeruginosa TaxID=287 RepID=UPI0010CD62CC|nr:HrgA protein [Pseudomonas aeruginosa]QCQ88305.1 HrgA protein [Pseudomonas aeruginosa]